MGSKIYCLKQLFSAKMSPWISWLKGSILASADQDATLASFVLIPFYIIIIAKSAVLYNFSTSQIVII